MEFSANWLMASLLVSTVGGGLFLYGKKQSRLPQLLCGIALIAQSMLVASVGWMFAAALGAIALLALALRAGW
ncbi:MAG: hypothetical protein IPK67_02070 [Planctomycetes bacterium]|jgi:hypothetical protein|nr:hypothetical protein [Planctomycetota bacterium]